MQEDFVRASEVAEFCFCKRGWWLRFHGKLHQTEAMKLGVIKHDKLAWRTRVFHKVKMIAYLLIGVGLMSIVVYVLLRFYFKIV